MATADGGSTWRAETPRLELLAAIVRGEYHRAAAGGAGDIRPFVREIAKFLYGFDGMAKHDDSLAMQQLEWAMRKGHPLPSWEEAETMVKTMELILERDGAAAAMEDLVMLADLQDLKAIRIAHCYRENYHSGAEYTEEVPVEGFLRCERIRALAKRLSEGRQG